MSGGKSRWQPGLTGGLFGFNITTERNNVQLVSVLSTHHATRAPSRRRHRKPMLRQVVRGKPVSGAYPISTRTSARGGPFYGFVGKQMEHGGG